MEHTFTADIVAQILFTDEEMDTLIEHCQRHYDATVRSLAEAKPSGIAAQVKYMRDLDKQLGILPHLPEALKFRQIDLFCKALEYPLSSDGAALRAKLVKVLHQINEISGTINATINS